MRTIVVGIVGGNRVPMGSFRPALVRGNQPAGRPGRTRLIIMLLIILGLAVSLLQSSGYSGLFGAACKIESDPTYALHACRRIFKSSKLVQGFFPGGLGFKGHKQAGTGRLKFWPFLCSPLSRPMFNHH